MTPRALRSRLLGILLAAGTALLPTIARAADCSPTTFVRARSFLAGSLPQSVVLGHFDADETLDAAVANRGYPYTVTVLPGDGNGAFGPPIATSVGPYDPEFLAAADFNGDGKLDLAVVDVFDITILLGNGDGTFQPALPSFRSATAPSGVAVGDFDGDGKPDLVEVSGSDGTLVFFGNGNGTFGPAVPMDPVSSASSVGVGDLDGDGRADIVVSLAYSSTARVYLGQADRTFQPAPDLVVDTPLGPLTLGDFDGDGKLDVAVIANAYAAILIGNGDGTFQAAIESPFGYAPVGLTAADLDSDGNLDLVATLGDSNGNLVFLLGNGGGLLTLGGGYQTGPNGISAVVGDLDGDGLPDIVTADAGATTISVLQSLNAGRFLGIETIPTLPNVGNIASGDFNGDGTPDLATVGLFPNGSNEGAVQTLIGDGRGGFQGSTPADAGYGASWLAAGDFDEDGRLDVAVTSMYQNSVAVLLGNGDGTFQAPTANPISYSGRALAAADFNRDGHLDLAVIEGVFSSPGTVAIMLGNGDGTFQAPIEQSLPALPAGLYVADLNGDGKPDVAISNQTLITGQDTISVLLGNGDGTLTAPVPYASGPSPQGLVGGDFNGDGKLDLVVADTGASNVSLLLGNGDGTFGPPTLIAVGSNPVFVAAADFDQDGKLDFVTANGGTISLLLGLGTGAFLSPVIYFAGPNASFLLADDLIGSGSVDLAVANSGGANASIFLNSQLSAFVASRSVFVGSSQQMRVSASGYGVLSYQWRKGGVPIVGATGSTLTIDPAAFADAGSYDVLVTDSCTTVASNAATLSVEFADVPASNIFHGDIITIATAGVTAGCGGANYCPTGLVSRAQMAVFLLKSEHGSAYAPPTCTGMFADVPCPSPFANWIEQLANEGVTAGCGNGNYCPDATVTRAQMAIFLLKTSQGSGYAPPTAVGIFGDVPVGSFGADFIEDLYNRGITGGCSASPLLYCPNNTVNRGQMAAFLVNTFFGP